MSEVYYMLTYSVRDAWKKFLDMRPNDEAVELEDLLDDLIPASGDDVPMSDDGAFLLTHPDYPAALFIARDDRGERVLVGMRRRRSPFASKPNLSDVARGQDVERGLVVRFLTGWIEELSAGEVQDELMGVRDAIESLEHRVTNKEQR